MKEKLKIVPQYIKNVSKSSAYATQSIIQDIMPETSEFISTNSEIFRSVITDMRNFKSIVRQTKKNYDSSEANKAIRDIKKNFMEDLKTGNWFNKQRSDDAMFENSGFSDFVFDESDFDVELDDSGTNSTNAPISNADKVQIKTSMATTNAVMQNTNATLSSIEAGSKMVASSMMSSAEMITENQNSINSVNMVNTYKMYDQVSNILNEMNTNVRGLFQYTGNLTKYFNDSAEQYRSMVKRLDEIQAYNREFTEMQRNLYSNYKRDLESSNDRNKNGFISGGVMDFTEYFKEIKQRVKSVYDESMIGSMAGMMSNEKDKTGLLSMIKSVSGSPLSFLSKGIVNKTMSKNLKKSMANFEETFENFFTTALFKLSSKLKEKDGGFGPASTLYKIFGLDLGEKRNINTTKYTQGPVPYNGYADKSITEVIPTYLRKILSTLSGQPEMIYNYKAGRFMNETQIRNQYQNQNMSTYGMYGLKSDLRQTIKGTYSFNKSDTKEIDKGIDEFVKFMVDTGHFYDKNKDTAESLSELGLIMDPTVLSLIMGAMNSMSNKDLMKATKDQLNSIGYRKTASEQMNKELTQTGISALFNGSIDNKTTRISNIGSGSFLSASTDEYGKSVFNYLRDIRQILLEGINVYSVNISSKSKNKKVNNNKGSNFDDRMKKYSEEIKKTNTVAEMDEDEERLKRNAIENGTQYTSLLDLAFKDSTDMTNAFKNTRENETILKQLSDPNLGGGSNNNAINQFTQKYKSLFSNVFSNGGKLFDTPQNILANMLDKVSDNLMFLIYGVKDKDGRTFMDRITDKVGEMNSKIFDFVKQNIANPINEMLNGDHGIIPTVKKNLGPIIENLKNASSSFFTGVSNRLFGTSYIKNISPKQFYQQNISPRMKNTGIGAAAGLALSFVTPLGIIGGPLMGGALGFVSTFDSVKDKLFGKMENGERQGGIISKSILDKIKGSSKNMKIGLGIGAGVGLLTPLGLIGSTLMGGTLGFVSGIDSVKKKLLGDENSDGIIPKKWQEKFKEYRPQMIKGAGIGLVSSFFLPTGPVGGAVLGLAGSIALQSNKIKTYLFGDEDPETGKRNGGLFGKAKEFIKVNVLTPIKLGVKSMVAKGSHFVKTNIINPFLDSLEPLKKQFQIAKEELKGQIKAGWESTKTFIGGVFEKNVGKPFGQLMREKFIDPMKKFFSNIFSKLGKGIGAIISAPFKALNSKSKGFMDQQIKNGQADYDINAMNKAKKERQRKADEEYKAKMDKINKAKDENKKRRDYLEKENYSNQSIKNLNHVNDLMKKSNANTDKIADILTDIWKATKNIAKGVGASATDAFSDIKSNIRLNSIYQKRKKAHDVKHIINTPKVIPLGDGSVNKDKGTHYSGLDYVPEDGYQATLHEGEMVLPKDQAEYIRKILGSGKGKGKSNGFVNGIKNALKGKMDFSNLLSKIYTEVFSIRQILIGKSSYGSNIGDKKSPIEKKVDKINDNIKEMTKNVQSIKDDIYGQVNGVGYNTEMISNIMIDLFGYPSKMPKGVKKGFHVIKTGISKIFDFIKKPFKLLAKPLKIISGIVNTVKEKVTGFISKLAVIPKKIFSGIKTVVNGALGIVKSVGKEIFGVMGSIAKAIPGMVESAFKLASSTLVEIFKTVGVVGREIFKGIGTVVNTAISSIGKFASSLVSLATKAIPGVIKAFGTVTKSIFNFVKSVGGGIINLVTKPFRKKEKISKNIKLIDKVNTIETINTIKNIEKISDPTLYGKLDNIITAIGGSNEPTNSAGTNADDIITNIESNKEGKKSNIFSKIKNKIFGGRNDRENTQVQVFNNKEAAEDAMKKQAASEKLKEKAYNSINNISNFFTNASKKTGIFGVLWTALTTFIIPFFKKAKTKIVEWGMSLIKKGIPKVIDLVKKKIPLLKNFIGEKGTKVFTKIKGLFSSFSSWIKTDLKYKIQDAKYQLQQVMQNVGQRVQNGIDRFRNWKNARNLSKLSNIGRAGELALEGGQAASTGGQLLLGAGEAAGAASGSSVAGGVAAGAGGIGILSRIKGFGKRVASKFGKRAAASAAENVASNAGREVFTGTVMTSSEYAAEIAAKNAARNAATNVSKEIVVNSATAVTKGGISGLIKRIFSCSAMKKLAGSKIGSVLTQLGKFLIDKLKNVGGKFVAKLSAKWGALTASGVASGMIIPAIWTGGSILLGAAKTNRIFEMDPDYKPSKMMKLIAGFANFISNNVTFGIVDANTIAMFLASYLLTDKEVGEIKDTQKDLKSDYKAYKEKTGKNISFEDYNKKVNKGFFGKAADKIKSGASTAWNGIKTGASYVGKGVKKVGTGIYKGADFVNASIGALFGLKDENGKKASFTKWGKGKVKGAWTEIKKLPGEVVEGAKNTWSGLKNTFTTANKYAKKGAEMFDSGLGAMFGLTDKKGNPLSFTKWGKGKVKDAWDGTKKLTGEALNKAKHVWGTVKDKFIKVNKHVKKGLGKLNKKLGSMLGLTDKKGNPISLTDWGKGKIKDAWDTAKELPHKFLKQIKKFWGFLGDGFSALKKWAKKGLGKLNNKLGELMGFEDKNGKPISLSKGIKKSWNGFINKAKNYYKDEIKPRMDAGSGSGGKKKSNGIMNSFNPFTQSTKTTKSSSKPSTKMQTLGFDGSYDSTQKVKNTNTAAKASASATYGTKKSNRKPGLTYINGAVYYSQSDPQWANHMYGNSGTVGSSGCGPTSAAMLLSTVTNKTINPAQAADWSKGHGYRIEGGGTSWGFFPAIARSYGMDLTQTNSKEDIRTALKSGHPVILSGQDARGRNSQNPFTSAGHLVLATGVTSDGKNIIINDPISKERSVAYGFDDVFSKVATGWKSSVTLDSTVNSTNLTDDSSSSDGESEDKEDPFTSAITKIATYTGGLVTSLAAGKVFKASDYDEDKKEAESTSASSNNGTPAMNITSDVAKSTWNYFTSAGYSKPATAGIMGNLYQESGMNPSSIQGNGAGPAAGIAQWENYNTKSSRWKSLNDYAASKGKPWTDLGSQLEFIDSELKGLGSFWRLQSNMEKAGTTGTSYEEWKKSSNVETATRQFEGAFERAGIPAMDNRIKAANSYYATYADGGKGDDTTQNYRPTIATSKMTLNQNKALSDSASDSITINKFSSIGVSSDQLSMIIDLLTQINSNTATTAQNTSIMSNKNFNNVSVNNETDNNQNNENINYGSNANRTNGNSNSLETATTTNGTSTVSAAYQKAKKIANGIY